MGDFLVSPNGNYTAIMQNDGNFVVYQGTGGQVTWASSSIPYFYGNAGIPRGQNATEVGNRYINPDSLVFLTVDTTAVPFTPSHTRPSMGSNAAARSAGASRYLARVNAIVARASHLPGLKVNNRAVAGSP
jgi:hypothetical protein